MSKSVCEQDLGRPLGVPSVIVCERDLGRPQGVPSVIVCEQDLGRPQGVPSVIQSLHHITGGGGFHKQQTVEVYYVQLLNPECSEDLLCVP